jgi:hypothetical protein
MRCGPGEYLLFYKTQNRNRKDLFLFEVASALATSNFFGTAKLQLD